MKTNKTDKIKQTKFVWLITTKTNLLKHNKILCFGYNSKQVNKFNLTFDATTINNSLT